MENLDCLGLKPSLLISGKLRHVTWLGIFFSCLCTGFILAFGLYFFIRLFQRKVFSVSQSSGITSFPRIEDSYVPIIFKIVDGSISMIPHEEKYYNFQGFAAGAPGKLSNFTHSTWFEVEYCDINKHFGKYKQYFMNVPELETYHCVANFEKLNLTMYGTYGNMETGYSSFDLLINMCTNETSNNTCATLEEQKQVLKSLFLNYGFLDNTINHEEVENPVKPALVQEFLPISATLFTRYYYNYRTVDYSTDYGYVFPDIDKKHFRQLDSKSTYVDLSVNLGGDSVVAVKGVKFGHISNMMNQVAINYNRNYAKLQEVMASIGGVLSALMFVGYVIVNFFGRRIYGIKLANIFFQFRENKVVKKNISEVMIELKKFNQPDKEEKVIKNVNLENLRNNADIIQETENININVDSCMQSSPDSSPGKAMVISMEESKTSALDKKLEKLKFQFEGRVDENGKLKINFNNVIFPNKAIKKIIDITEKKISIDEILKYCSEIEKVKKYLFDEEHLILFNNLPDMDFEEVLRPHKAKNKSEMRKSLAKMMTNNPDSKIVKMMMK